MCCSLAIPFTFDSTFRTSFHFRGRGPTRAILVPSYVKFVIPPGRGGRPREAGTGIVRIRIIVRIRSGAPVCCDLAVSCRPETVPAGGARRPAPPLLSVPGRWALRPGGLGPRCALTLSLHVGAARTCRVVCSVERRRSNGSPPPLGVTRCARRDYTPHPSPDRFRTRPAVWARGDKMLYRQTGDRSLEGSLPAPRASKHRLRDYL